MNACTSLLLAIVLESEDEWRVCPRLIVRLCIANWLYAPHKRIFYALIEIFTLRWGTAWCVAKYWEAETSQENGTHFGDFIPNTWAHSSTTYTRGQVLFSLKDLDESSIKR